MKPLGAAQSAAVYVGLGLFGRFSSFLMLPVVASTMPLSEYGEIVLAVTATALLSTLIGLGLETPTTRASLVLDGSGSAGRLRGMLLASRALGLACLVLATIPLLLSDATAFGVRSEVLGLAMGAAALSAPTQAVVLPSLRARQRLTAFSAVAGSVVAVSVLGRLVALLIFDAGPIGWFVAEVVAQALGFLLGALVCRGRRSEFPPDAEVESPSFNAALREGKQGILMGLPLVPHALSHWGLNLGDRALVGAFLSLRDVALYAVAYQLASVCFLIATEVNRALMPRYATMTVESQRSMRTQVERHIAGTGAAFILFALVLVVLGPVIFPVSYVASLQYAPALVGAHLLLALYFVPANLMTLAAGRTSQIWKASLAALGVNLSVDLVLLSSLGVWAAVVGTIAGYATLLLASLYLERRGGRSLMSWAYSIGWASRFGLALAASSVGLAGLSSPGLPPLLQTVGALSAAGTWFLLLQRPDRRGPSSVDASATSVA